MSNIGKFPKLKLLFKDNKAQQKLKSTTGSITFPHVGRSSDLIIIYYADATYASLEDGSSLGDFIIFVCGMTNIMTPIFWSSKKLDQETKSPFASMIPTLSEAAKAGVSKVAILQETFRLPRRPKVLGKTDNTSLIETLNPSNMVSDQCLRIDVARVKEMISKKETQTEWIKGKEQVADYLTKVGAFPESFRDLLHD